MKSTIAALFVLCCYVQGHTQTDTTLRKSKVKLFSVKADIGVPPWLVAPQSSQQDYQKLVPGNELLKADYSSYKNSEPAWFMAQNMNIMPTIRLYADLGGKKYKKEIYIGLSYSQELVSGFYLNRESNDTVGTYVNTSTNKLLYEITTTNDSYQFGIQATRWMIPLGFNFTTNRDKFFWVSAGLELAPAVSTNYRFVSWHSVSQMDRLVEPGSPIDYNSGYMNYGDNTYSQSTKSTSVSGMGFGLYASVPFCAYMHPFKRVKVLKHLNPSASLMPYFGLTKHKSTAVNTGFGIMASLGLRYNW